MCGQGICVGRKAALCAGTYFVILKKPSIAARRPEDYYTEMVKTDDHMRRVRQNLLTEKQKLEASEQAKKQRAFKKYGKKVQQSILQQRQQQKKNMLETVERHRKDLKNRLPVEDDQFDIALEAAQADRGGARGKSGPSLKRQQKDKKYGFGGKKRHSRSNTKESFSDTSDFSLSAMKQPFKDRGARTGGRGGKGGRGSKRIGNSKPQRPGKAKRQSTKRR
eukprot:m.84627 g.84627  ORF g.84627 m.84627 type:complete len:221 (-) comp14812_c0_seq3:253-915(-)